MAQVIPIPAFTDNYIWAITNQQNRSVYVIDPGDAEPVFKFCLAQSVSLKGILITHHHWDHTNGVEKLVEHFKGVPVYGPNDSKFNGLTKTLSDGQVIELPECGTHFKVMHVPGHTLDHIAYYNDSMIFCGDTLFNGGCGRLFEGTPTQMYRSLNKIAALPEHTKVYCTHEYTRANLAFAASIEPNNSTLMTYQAELNQHNDISLPSTIGIQKRINPFLRTANQEVKRGIQHRTAHLLKDNLAFFTALRELKDNF